MQKVCFSDKENLSTSSPPKIGKLNTTLSSNSMHRSLRVALQVALETQQNAFLKLNASLPKGRSAGRVGKLNTTLSYGSRCGAGTKFYRRFCRNSDRFILRSNTCG
ncbi:Hypothetical protein G436_4179 [Leptospira interrogans serovar Hardjo str. Norma]|uniref:Uncharacterized protein n=2 Tax=Leptospira interrogans TaxID=173 RepID=M6GBU1_LEPIR|nr:Hypothetical protein G436_4179 [Leptospira interrogans serovar Hardjo str. Norma]EMM82418.1 hypothetical protein LEP1GSC037_1849 [Leptospira interrogans str. 2006001854]